MAKDKTIKSKDNWYCWHCGKKLGNEIMLWSLNDRIDRVFMVCHREFCQEMVKFGDGEKFIRLVKSK